MERRPELLSSVMLRQNPHNVHEWHKRVKLFEGNPHRQIVTYTEAVTTVDPDKVRIFFHRPPEVHFQPLFMHLMFRQLISTPPWPVS